MNDPAAACLEEDIPHEFVSPRNASWPKVRTLALQNRQTSTSPPPPSPKLSWDTLLGEQQVGQPGWLSKLKQRILGPRSQSPTNHNLRGSFGAARTRARGSVSAAPPLEKVDQVLPFDERRSRESSSDLLSSATDHLQVPDPTTQATDPVAAMAEVPDGVRLGWRGSIKEGEVIDGLFESPDEIKKRRQLRRAPEVVAQVKRLWEVAHKWQFRMEIASYFDFHLSVFYYIIE